MESYPIKHAHSTGFAYIKGLSYTSGLFYWLQDNPMIASSANGVTLKDSSQMGRY